jgi:hypothetical protein
MSGSGSPATRGPITPRQARIVVAVLCAASVIGVVSAGANSNGNGSANVTRTREHSKDQPIDDINKCNGHRVLGMGQLIVEQKEKTSPGRFETWFKIFQHGQVHWDLNPNERYQYHFMNEDYTRTSTPHWTMTTETRKNIVLLGSDHYGKGRRPKGDSWFFYERVTMSSSGVSSDRDKFRDECR